MSEPDVDVTMRCSKCSYEVCITRPEELMRHTREKHPTRPREQRSFPTMRGLLDSVTKTERVAKPTTSKTKAAGSKPKVDGTSNVLISDAKAKTGVSLPVSIDLKKIEKKSREETPVAVTPDVLRKLREESARKYVWGKKPETVKRSGSIGKAESPTASHTSFVSPTVTNRGHPLPPTVRRVVSSSSHKEPTSLSVPTSKKQSRIPVRVTKKLLLSTPSSYIGSPIPMVTPPPPTPVSCASSASPKPDIATPPATATSPSSSFSQPESPDASSSQPSEPLVPLPLNIRQLPSAAPPHPNLIPIIRSPPRPAYSYLSNDPRTRFLGAPSLYMEGHPMAKYLQRFREVAVLGNVEYSCRYPQIPTTLGSIAWEEVAILNDGTSYRLTTTWVPKPAMMSTSEAGTNTDTPE